MSDKNVLPIPPVYHELAQLLFMLEMSSVNFSSADSSVLKSKIDELVDYIHANNIIQNHPYLKNL